MPSGNAKKQPSGQFRPSVVAVVVAVVVETEPSLLEPLPGLLVPLEVLWIMLASDLVLRLMEAPLAKAMKELKTKRVLTSIVLVGILGLFKADESIDFFVRFEMSPRSVCSNDSEGWINRRQVLLLITSNRWMS